MNDLAEVYLDGADGVPVNKARAIELYKKPPMKALEKHKGLLAYAMQQEMAFRRMTTKHSAGFLWQHRQLSCGSNCTAAQDTG